MLNTPRGESGAIVILLRMPCSANWHQASASGTRCVAEPLAREEHGRNPSLGEASGVDA